MDKKLTLTKFQTIAKELFGHHRDSDKINEICEDIMDQKLSLRDIAKMRGVPIPLVAGVAHIFYTPNVTGEPEGDNGNE